MIAFLLFLVLGILLLAGFFLRLIGGIFFPFSGLFGRQRPEEPKRKPEGSVSIDYVPPRQEMKDIRPGNNVPDSEYVEYEELDDPEAPEKPDNE
ncbi:MAG: hypothetical protein NC048_01995 [Bacteroides sp.]|nr:hypothetical protein [Ruminococcus flavefaciens]MCM1554251.1 hypothetical protein [Bacteroides sp.]